MVKTIAIVSLSSGAMGEGFAAHEVELGLARLEKYGCRVKFMPNALKGIAYLQGNPQARADDLLTALRDPEVDMILCAIGGDDTYRLLPYLFDDDRLKNALHDKIFLGFSDTTINHFMLHKAGLNTFYGQAFLPDIAELDTEMLPYTRRYFEELLSTGKISEITPAGIWYEERTSYAPDRLGTARAAHSDTGFELLQGAPVFGGEILGGCIDSIYDIFDGTRYADAPQLCQKYGLFPTLEDWRGKLLLLESSEEAPTPEKYRSMLLALKATGIFGVINGVLVGKPMNNIYHAEYKRMLAEVIADASLPVLCNINIGHAAPRCIMPLGVYALADYTRQRISFDYKK